MSGGKKKPSRRPPARRAAQRPPAKPAPRPAAAPAPPPKTKPTQAQRLESARRARAAHSRNVRLAIGAAVALLVAIVVVTTMSSRKKDQSLRARLEAGSCTFDTRNDEISPAPNNHVPPASYKVDPPAGGNHDPSPAAAGTYTEANKPADARVVHALEHGYVALWHRPGLPEKDLAAIQQVADRYDRDVVVLPHATVTTDVVATAWGERLSCPSVETGPLTEFVKAYRNKGPERVPH